MEAKDLYGLDHLQKGEGFFQHTHPHTAFKKRVHIACVFRERRTKLSSSGLDENMGFSDRIWNETQISSCGFKL